MHIQKFMPTQEEVKSLFLAYLPNEPSGFRLEIFSFGFFP
jgi:hypothetical protein